MNPMLMQLIAARAGASGNSSLAEMMARMNSGEAMPAIDTQELLARYGNDNPTIKLLLQQMAAQQEVAPSDTGGRVIEGEFSERISEEDDGDGMQDMQQEIEDAGAQMRALQERSALLAAALGACPLCWGDDSRCPGCRGRGAPGFSMPDEDLFREYVAPAVRTLRALKMSLQGRTN